MTTHAMLQKAFNHAAKHLLTQKERAFDMDAGCVLRTKQGLRCAIGCFIKPEYFVGDIQNVTFVPVFEEDTSIIKQIKADKQRQFRKLAAESGFKFDSDDREFLYELQKIHDYHALIEWKHRLAVLADKYKLKRDVLIGFQSEPYTSNLDF